MDSGRGAARYEVSPDGCGELQQGELSGVKSPIDPLPSFAVSTRPIKEVRMRLSLALVAAALVSPAAAVFVATAGLVWADPPPSPAANEQVHSAGDADLIVKEWHSPITFSIDAGWLGSLPFDQLYRPPGVPEFYCDDATIYNLALTKSRPTPGSVRLRFDFDLYVKDSTHDKYVETEFSLINGDAILPLGRGEDKVRDGHTRSTWVWYEKSESQFAPYFAGGTRLRVSMIVRND